jgi:predicted RND superfamily exporter protein
MKTLKVKLAKAGFSVISEFKDTIAIIIKRESNLSKETIADLKYIREKIEKVQEILSKSLSLDTAAPEIQYAEERSEQLSEKVEEALKELKK